MKRKHSNLLLGGIGLLFLISCGLVGYSIYQNHTANEEFTEILKQQLNFPISTSTTNTPVLTLDEQIQIARRQLQKASFEINKLKSRISIHASDAANQRTIAEAQRLLNDISQNSEKVVVQNQQIQEQMAEIIALYQQKVEQIYKAKDEKSNTGFGLAFWVGVIGILASISSIVLAWKKDKREIVELEHKLSSTHD